MARVTLEHIETRISDEDYHLFPGTLMTVCCLTLVNGFNTIGTAACADPSIFNEELGKQFAKKDAVSKVWVLEGYRLKEALALSDFKVIDQFPQ